MSGLEVTFDVDLRWVERALRELAAALNKPYAEIVRANGRLIAVNLAIQTQPLGAGEDARRQGINAVRRDIAKVYRAIRSEYTLLRFVSLKGKETGEQLAKAFYAALKRGKLDVAQRILRSAGILTPIGRFDGGDAHKRRRNARGQVQGSGTSLIVTDPNSVKAYVTKIIENVGIAKGGWAGAASDLGGTRGLPRWMNKHKQNGEAVDNTGNINHPHVILRNRVPWLRYALNDRQIKEALRIQREKMETRIEIVTTAIAKKHLA